MPNHAHCVVPMCSNRKNACKWDLVASEDGQGYTKKHLCGATNDVGCMGRAEICKGLSFHRLPADSQGSLRQEWIQRMRRVNTPLTPNSFVCGVHFAGKRRMSTADLPSVFLWSKPQKKRMTHVSLCAESSAMGSVSQGTLSGKLLAAAADSCEAGSRDQLDIGQMANSQDSDEVAFL